MAATLVWRSIRAPRTAVFAALLDPAAVAVWKVPRDMTLQLHVFEGRVGGAVHATLTYDAPDPAGKTSAHSDTYRGTFTEIVPDERVVEVDVFESDDPAMRTPMTATIELVDEPDGTAIRARHEGLPDGVSAEDNQLGWAEALDRLAALVEQPTTETGRPA